MYNAGDELRIGKRVAKNRITMAPTVKFFAGEDGIVKDEFVAHYEERARHGCGFIVVEATCIDKAGRLAPSQLGLWCDEQIEGHSKIAEACHKYGALVVPQIHHGGLGTHPACGPYTGPSATLWGWGDHRAEAVELSGEDIRQLIREYVESAVRAQKAGYDGVQLHACHGYLINNFTGFVNKRTDEYGGSLENMARFGCEIIEGIRRACGENFIISARVSGCDPSYEEALEIAEYYVRSGCDFLQTSCGMKDLEDMEHDESLPYGVVAALGVKMHERFRGRVPVSLVCGIRTPEQVKYLMDNELVDAVDLACGLLADPAFTEAILQGAPYRKCFSCKNGCAFGPGHTHPCPAMKLRGVNEFGFNTIKGI